MKEELMKLTVDELKKMLNQSIKESSKELPKPDFFKKFEEKNEKLLVMI